MSNSSSNYLIRNKHSWCFRLRIPPDLTKSFGKTEIRYSLKTGYIGVARTRARFLAGNIQQLIIKLRKTEGIASMPTSLTKEDIQQLISGWVKEVLEDDEHDRIIGKRKTDGDIEHYLDGLNFIHSDNKEALAKNELTERFITFY